MSARNAPLSPPSSCCFRRQFVQRTPTAATSVRVRGCRGCSSPRPASCSCRRRRDRRARRPSAPTARASLTCTCACACRLWPRWGSSPRGGRPSCGRPLRGLLLCATPSDRKRSREQVLPLRDILRPTARRAAERRADGRRRRREAAPMRGATLGGREGAPQRRACGDGAALGRRRATSSRPIRAHPAGPDGGGPRVALAV